MSALKKLKEGFGTKKHKNGGTNGIVDAADRKVAMGQHWHQQCFRCSTCGRFLDPERHQEHDGDPYCNMCYNNVTQPRALVQPPQSPQEKNEIASRIRDYNLYKENKVDHIKHREVSENLLYEGVIRLYWGLNKPIILSSGGPNYGRQRGFRESLYNYVSIDDEGFSKLFESAQKNNELVSTEEMQKYMELSRDDDTATQSLNDSALQALRYGPYGDSTTGDDTIEEEDRVGDDYVLVHSDGETEDDEECDSEPEMQSSPHRQRVVLRQKSDIKPQRVRQAGIRRRSASFRKVQRHKRQAEAREEKRSKFIPPYGKPTNLRVSSIQGTDEVISMLLQKYNVENPPVQFALFVIHDSGAIEVLTEQDSPLAVRLKLGPSEDVAKIYVMERENAEKLRVSQETAEYIKFQIPELNIFLKKYDEEEERECQKIRSKFANWKKAIEEQLQVSG